MEGRPPYRPQGFCKSLEIILTRTVENKRTKHMLGGEDSGIPDHSEEKASRRETKRENGRGLSSVNFPEQKRVRALAKSGKISQPQDRKTARPQDRKTARPQDRKTVNRSRAIDMHEIARLLCTRTLAESFFPTKQSHEYHNLLSAATHFQNLFSREHGCVKKAVKDDPRCVVQNPFCPENAMILIDTAPMKDVLIGACARCHQVSIEHAAHYS